MEAIALSLIPNRRCDSSSSKTWRIGFKKIKKRRFDCVTNFVLVDEEEQVTR
jgi:hypothetical protein